jgi:steroid delta-isomerase-like uncharacterized protein
MKSMINIFIKIFVLFLLIAFYGCSEKDSSVDLKKKVDMYVEYWNTANFKGIESLLCDDFELIESPTFDAQKGIENFKQTVLAYHTAYPDFKLIVNETIYDKDKIAGIWTISATNTGQGSKPPTGKHISVKGIGIIHFRDGKIKDEWIAGNDYHWLEQLGYTLVPPKTGSEEKK